MIDIPIMVSIAGFGLIAYGVVRMKSQNIEELAKAIIKQQNKEELDQLEPKDLDW